MEETETRPGEKSPKGKRSYTYDALMRLNNIEACLIDTRRSRDTVMNNIEKILKRENSKLLTEREKNSCSLQLERYQNDVTKQTKELEEERSRINSLRENIRLRRAALEDAKERYLNGNEYLEKVILNGVDVLSEALSVTTSRLCARKRELIADLLTIYPIEPIDTEALSFKILGIPLPNSVFTGCDDEKVATALGFTCHLIQMLAFYLAIPLRFPMTPKSSRSEIHDPISISVTPRQDYIPPYVVYMAPLFGLLSMLVMNEGERHVNNNQLEALLPLYAKGADRGQFEYAVFLLNKNIEQLMNSQGLAVSDLRHTLPNLKYLFDLISAPPGQAYYRKFVPHNYAIPKNDIANSRTHLPFISEVASSSNTSYHHNIFPNGGPSSRSSSRSSTRSTEANSSPKKSLTPIAIPKGAESHRRRTSGFEVGVT